MVGLGVGADLGLLAASDIVMGLMKLFTVRLRMDRHGLTIEICLLVCPSELLNCFARCYGWCGTSENR